MARVPQFRLHGREPAVGNDVEAEIDFHLTEMADLLIAQGWEPNAARQEALRQFGSVERARRVLSRIDSQTRRRTRRFEVLGDLAQDVRVGFRGLLRQPTFALTAVATLGLAIGANAAMFGIVDRLLLRPPAHISDPARVQRVTVARWLDGRLTEPWSSISYPAFTYLRDGVPSFSHVAAVDGATLSLGLGAEARRVRAELATGRFFELVGTRPALGRFFGDQEDQRPNGTAVAVLSEALWRTGFGADAQVVGRKVILNGRPFEIVGVTPRGFTGLGLAPVDMWVPFSAGGMALGRAGNHHTWTQRGWQFIEAVVRLAEGATVARAAEEAASAYQRGHADYDEFEARARPTLTAITGANASADPLHAAEARVAGWLFGVTLLVLLIASANVSNLLLARGLARRAELALRTALGAGRWRLGRQLAAESGLLAVLGAGVGLLLAQGAGGLARRSLLAGTAWTESPVNGRVLLVTIAVTAFAALLAGLLPLVRSARTDAAGELRGSARAAGGGSNRLRIGLLLVQTTLSTALLAGAGLFLRSVERVRRIDLGIDAQHALAVGVNLTGIGATPEQAREFYRQAVERLATVPGVEAVGPIIGAPFMSNSSEGVRVPGLDTMPRLPGGGPYYFRAGPGTLEALGVRLLRGRLFTAGDRAGAPPVAVVSDRMARLLWPGKDPIGRCFVAAPSDSAAPCREVVGIVADLHRQELDEAPFMLYFTVIDQWSEPGVPDQILVRAKGSPEELIEPVRRALLELRSDLPYVNARPYEEIIAPQSRSWRLGAAMLTGFGTLSLVIAAMGLYGVLSFAVTQRIREFGIRTALGATPGRLIRGVVAGGVGVAIAGVGLGLVIVAAISGRLTPLLYRTTAGDPLVLASAALIVLLIGAIASAVPARRAARVDPIGALRAE